MAVNNCDADYYSSCLHSIAVTVFAFNMVIAVAVFIFKIGTVVTKVIEVASFTGLYCNQSIALEPAVFITVVNIIKATSVKTTCSTITDTLAVQMLLYSNSTLIPFNFTNTANLFKD